MSGAPLESALFHPTHSQETRMNVAPGWDWVGLGVVVAGFLIRLWAASGTFLNPDEALHFLIANKNSWSAEYHASLYSAHPPLLIFVLYFWRRLGISELMLRLPSVLAGTASCWIAYKWMQTALGRRAALAGVVLLAFLPPMIELSSEVRQYGLLLLFMSLSLLLLERAFQRRSVALMILSGISTYLAMLTHYSALLFAGTVAVYGLVRLWTEEQPVSLVSTWVVSQVGVAALLAFLYRTQIAPLRASAASEAVQGWLHNSFFHSGKDNPIVFAVARSFGAFQFTMGQLAVGDIAGLLFIFAMVLLLRRREVAETSPRSLAVLLVLPFVLACATAFVGLYPYGGTRHSAFLTLFAIAGVALGLDRLARERVAVSVGAACVIVILCAALGSPHRPFITRADQRIGNMQNAIGAIRAQVPAGGMVLVDYQSSRLLGRYFCGVAVMQYDLSHPQLQVFDCGGVRVISSEPDVLIFTPETFRSTLQRAVEELRIPAEQRVWIFQGGWDIELAAELKSKTEFRGLTVESFGHNLQLFSVAAAQGLSPSARKVTGSGVAWPLASLVTTPNPPL